MSNFVGLYPANSTAVIEDCLTWIPVSLDRLFPGKVLSGQDESFVGLTRKLSGCRCSRFGSPVQRR